MNALCPPVCLEGRSSIIKTKENCLLFSVEGDNRFGSICSARFARRDFEPLTMQGIRLHVCNQGVHKDKQFDKHITKSHY